MGSELRRQLREALGADIKGLQRAVALEIADDARYDDDWRFDPQGGHRSKARLADLVRWTAAKDELSVREMLRRLSVAGWEFRLPIGKGKDGRLLYAVPGVAMQFRVPDFEAPAINAFTNDGVTSEGPTVVGPIDPTTVGSMSGNEEQGPTVVGEGPTVVGEDPTVVGEDPTVVGSPSPVLLSSSPKDSPSSVAEASDEVLEGVVVPGGGGGDSSNGYIQRADAFVGSLDYRGKPPGRTRKDKLAILVVAAFKAGWTEQTLRDYLDLGDRAVASPAAVYQHRLKADELPEPPTPLAAAGRQLPPPACSSCLEESPASEFNIRLRFRQGEACPDCHPSVARGNRVHGALATGDWQGTGTDDRVAGWMALATGLAEPEAPTRSWAPKPVNGVWSRLETETTNGLRPAGADRVPHCGDPVCDEYSRTRLTDTGDGTPSHTMCDRCHPALRF